MCRARSCGAGSGRRRLYVQSQVLWRRVYVQSPVMWRRVSDPAARRLSGRKKHHSRLPAALSGSQCTRVVIAAALLGLRLLAGFSHRICAGSAAVLLAGIHRTSARRMGAFVGDRIRNRGTHETLLLGNRHQMDARPRGVAQPRLLPAGSSIDQNGSSP